MKSRLNFRVIRTSLVMFAAVAAMAFLAQSANAQSCGYGGGFGGGGYGGGYSGYGGRGISINVGRGYGGFGGGYSAYRPSYGGGYFHDTSHYDYHPGGLVPHGNHYDYQPGHYDLHRTGHWHH